MLFYLLNGHIQKGVLFTGLQLLPDSREDAMPLKQGAPLAPFSVFQCIWIPFLLYETVLSGLVLCVSAVSNPGLDHSCWLWFFKNLFQLQKLIQASLYRFLCHCCHLREVSNIAGWAFLNVDEFQQPGDENVHLAHCGKNTVWMAQNKRLYVGCLHSVRDILKNIQGKACPDYCCNSVWIKHWVIASLSSASQPACSVVHSKNHINEPIRFPGLFAHINVQLDAQMPRACMQSSSIIIWK